MKEATCILGAGFSHVAGLPLTRDLFETEVDVYSNTASKKMDAVWTSYSEWKKLNPEGNAEVYLSDLYLSKLLYTNLHVPFEWASSLIASSLATPPKENPARNHRTPRYTDRLIYPTHCDVHTKFWQTIVSFYQQFSVVTTNYDLLIEKSLRHKPMKRVFGVGFHYGGLRNPQVLHGQGSNIYQIPKLVALKGNIPVYKLHGSLSWSHEFNNLRLYQDMRPAYRKSGAAIVPPIKEKCMPQWLNEVWTEAHQKPKRSQIWIVCGYSLPMYDIAIRELLAKSNNQVEKIYILDPYSELLINRWNDIAPQAVVIPLKGLPDGIDALKDVLGKIQ